MIRYVIIDVKFIILFSLSLLLGIVTISSAFALDWKFTLDSTKYDVLNIKDAGIMFKNYFAKITDKAHGFFTSQSEKSAYKIIRNEIPKIMESCNPTTGTELPSNHPELINPITNNTSNAISLYHKLCDDHMSFVYEICQADKTIMTDAKSSCDISFNYLQRYKITDQKVISDLAYKYMAFIAEAFTG